MRFSNLNNTGICLYQVVQIIGRNVMGQKNHMCVQLCIYVDICKDYLGDIVTLIIYLYCLRSMPIQAFSLFLISVFEFQVFRIASSN